MAKPKVLVLNHGGLRSAVATAMICAETSGAAARVRMLFIDDGSPTSALRHKAASAQARHYHIADCGELAMRHLTPPASDDSESVPAKIETPLRQLQILTAASGAALAAEAPRLVWPVQLGDEFEPAAKVIESLVLLRHLIETAHGARLQIDTPLLEMTDAQVVEVGHQMDVPWDRTWSCQTDGETPCMACLLCQRREVAFRKVGIEDPLTSPVTTA